MLFVQLNMLQETLVNILDNDEFQFALHTKYRFMINFNKRKMRNNFYYYSFLENYACFKNLKKICKRETY